MVEGKKLGVAHVAATSSEAELVRNILEDAGLFVVIPDQNVPLPGLDLTPFDGDYSGTGCVVLVRTEDVDEAKSVIADARASSALLGSSDDEDSEATDSEAADSESGEAADSGGDGGGE